jgi:hypothetical protein
MVDFLSAIFNLISYIRALFNSVRSPFTKLEVALLCELKKHLNAHELEIFENQLEDINSIQRAPRHEYINFYKLTPFSVSRDRALKFKSKSEDWILRKSRIKIKGEYEVVAKFWIVNGNFFSITFNKPVKQYRNETDVKLRVIGHDEKGDLESEVEEMGS